MTLVETFKGKSVVEHQVEIVERKGTGHPDQMCDSIMEAISIALCQEYLKKFGTILHHNIDKGLLIAGRVEKHFGGGQVLEPMELIVGDRATSSRDGREISIGKTAVDAATSWISTNLRFVDPQQHLRCRIALAPGSDELTDIFSRPGLVRVANDTSAAVGYYPLSPTEKIVLEIEHFLNSASFKKDYPETGEDIKVMGVRRGRELDLTVAMPLLARLVLSEQDYFTRKDSILREMRAFVAKFSGIGRFSINYNTLDVKGKGTDGVYLSLLGTSAEDADSGQVGRGNRVNGLISMNRPMGTEAAAGKNPVSHTGKIYNVLAHKMAREIYESLEGIKEVYVLLVSRIGMPIDKPQLATAQLLMERGRRIEQVIARVEELIEHELAQMNELCAALAKGEYPVC